MVPDIMAAVGPRVPPAAQQEQARFGQGADAARDGVVGYWYGKAPGLDRATDALRHANLIGTHPDGGAVALVGDDPGSQSYVKGKHADCARIGVASAASAPAARTSLAGVFIEAFLDLSDSLPSTYAERKPFAAAAPFSFRPAKLK